MARPHCSRDKGAMGRMTNALPAKTASKTGRVARSVLMRPDEVRDIKSAADYAGRDDRTIRRWAKRYGIGRQSGPGAPIEISLPALDMVLHGEWEALEKLRAGDRSNPDVIRIFDHIGLAP